jgi:hypothetical protein
LVPIAHRFVVRPMTPLCLPLMASSTTSVGDLAVVTSGLPRPMVAPVSGLPGAAGVEVEGIGPQLGDDAGSLLLDLVMCSAHTGVLRSATPGDVAPAYGSSKAAGPRVSGLYLPGSPSFLPLPINWR